MNILTVTTLFPNVVEPHHGIFTETTLKHLLATGKLTATVIAPVPWFPLKHSWFGKYASFARIPLTDERIGVRVLHPRYFLPPKVGMNLAPFLLASAVIPVVEKLIEEGNRFDVIDAHYFYPDGVAAMILGRRFKLPVVISALGTDINLIPKFYWPRKMICWAARHSFANIAVCEALRAEMAKLGIARNKTVTLRNGVDLQLFNPVDRPATRIQLGIEGFTVLSVGHLNDRKGHDRTISALALLPDVNLIIIGSGPSKNELRQLARFHKVNNRVRFIDPLPQAQLKRYYGACDLFVLASSREGWANVLLESMACGTPVVASNIWGTPEVINAPEAGVLMLNNTPDGIAKAVTFLRANPSDRALTRKYAERFDWSSTTTGQLNIFNAAKARMAISVQ
jgi:teichuronic acid biosynthesis glycosyltransferase TuaC